MRISACLLAAISLLVVSASSTALAVDESVAVVNVFLQKTFPVDGAETRFGLRFVDGAAIRPVAIGELEAILPHVTFYRSQLERDDFCFREVQIVVAHVEADGAAEFLWTSQPNFTNVSPTFLALFQGRTAMTAAEKRRLAQGIGQLLAPTMLRGSFTVELDENARSVAVNLLDGDRPWRVLQIGFDPQQRVSGIEVKMPERYQK